MDLFFVLLFICLCQTLPLSYSKEEKKKMRLVEGSLWGLRKLPVVGQSHLTNVDIE